MANQIIHCFLIIARFYAWLFNYCIFLLDFFQRSPAFLKNHTAVAYGAYIVTDGLSFIMTSSFN